MIFNIVKMHLFLIFVCLNLASCAVTGQKHNYKGTKHNNKGVIRVVKPSVVQELNSGIIYGNFQTLSRLQDVVVNKLQENGKIDSETNIPVRSFHNGNFIVENLRPGKYIISSIDTRNTVLDIFVLESDIEFYSIQVHEGEAVYAGSYKVTAGNVNGTNDTEKAIINRSALPTEKKILKHVSYLERNSIWFESLYARMQKLI